MARQPLRTGALAPSALLPAERLAAIHEAVLSWYEGQHRNLPWRATRDPYRVLVSEVMLQQTQVDRVLPKYLAFLAEFPTVEALAAAPRAAVIRAWEGMGYNIRAVRLHQTAQRVAADGGRFPSTLEGLLALPGLGPYTARAIACFALGQQVPVVDTNVRRTLGRMLRSALPREAGDRDALAAAEAALPAGQAYDWNQALMDLGATLCTARKPRCLLCPVADRCDARISGALDAELTQAAGLPGKQGAFAGSNRYYRGRFVNALRTTPGHALRPDELEAALPPDAPPLVPGRLRTLLEGLVRDGLAVWLSEGDVLRLALP